MTVQIFRNGLESTEISHFLSIRMAIALLYMEVHKLVEGLLCASYGAVILVTKILVP